MMTHNDVIFHGIYFVVIEDGEILLLKFGFLRLELMCQVAFHVRTTLSKSTRPVFFSFGPEVEQLLTSVQYFRKDCPLPLYYVFSRISMLIGF